MTDAKTRENVRWVLDKLGVDPTETQDEEIPAIYPIHDDCWDAQDTNLRINLRTLRYVCDHGNEEGDIWALRPAIERRTAGSALVPKTRTDLLTDDVEATSSTELVPAFSGTIKATNPVLKSDGKVLQLKPEQKLPSPEEIKAEREIRLEEIRTARAERRRGAGEKTIVALLALVFVVAGLMAAGLSGFANYNAFASTVADPTQARIWGAAGIIAAIVSFGGFTFVYWHAANRRTWESLRALVFALIGAGASILGTEIYIRANNLTAAAEVTSAATNRDVLETQLADWRRQLDGIPPETRSVEGLEVYIAEVERVGRTEQKPYRDAQNELGLAKRRDDLIMKIEAANAELLGQGSGNILLQAEQRASLPSWLFAVLLELFSSQATSIGLVALLILTGRRREDQSASG